ncbi:MAG: BatA domain-containing protein [Myxococcaceae bacterium]
MTWAHPWLLLGTLLAAVPLLVHLFDRRRPKPHAFPTLAFVLRSQKRTAARLRLRRLLLYAARTLLLLALPLALARPSFRSASTAARAGTSPLAATAIIVDASFSMRYGAPNSHFQRAVGEARSALQALRPEESVTLVWCDGDAKSVPRPTFDRRELQALLDKGEPSFLWADVRACIDAALQALETSPLGGRRIVLISDFAAHGLRLEGNAPLTAQAPTGTVPVDVWLRDVASTEGTLRNRALTGLSLEPSTYGGPLTYQWTLTARNFSPVEAKDVALELGDGRSVFVRSFLEIPALGSARKVLTHRFERPGQVSGEVILAPDALPEDDRQPFVLHLRGEHPVLLVNGAPQAVRYLDEAFFVETALRAPGSAFQVAIRDADIGLREDFSKYALIFLLNVPAPGTEAIRRLTRFVENGGALFITAGDQVSVDAYNAQFGSLLPRPLRAVRATADAPVSIQLSEPIHPALAPFEGAAREGLLGARFWRYVQVEAKAQHPKEDVLFSLADGTPGLIVSKRGGGHVAWFCATLDRDWSDFAIRTSFLPLLQRLAETLLGGLSEQSMLRARVGETLLLPETQEMPLAELQTTSGQRTPLTRTPQGWTTPTLQAPGVYTVLDARGVAQPALAFAVGLDPRESDLARIDTSHLLHVWGAAQQTDATARSDRTVPLWTWFLVAGVALLFAEGLLLRPPKRGQAPVRRDRMLA